MRYLLGLMLTLLPVSGHAADLIPLSTNEIDQKAAERSIVDQPSGDEHPVDQSWPYTNPYHPASATNFDPFATPLMPRSDTSGSAISGYGHFGDPLFPDSIIHRGVTAHPFAMDSPANLFGRDQRVGER
jgi:hypothetical protein